MVAVVAVVAVEEVVLLLLLEVVVLEVVTVVEVVLLEMVVVVLVKEALQFSATSAAEIRSESWFPSTTTPKHLSFKSLAISSAQASASKVPATACVSTAWSNLT